MSQLTGALVHPETTPTPTAPLSPAGLAAMHRLELAFAAPAVVRAVTRYEVASARTAELSAMDAREMSGAEFDSLALAQDVMVEARATLAAAGQLHLIEMHQTLAARYWELSALVDRLSSRESHYMTPEDWRQVYAALEERATIHFALARAGQLHLIEVAS